MANAYRTDDRYRSWRLKSEKTQRHMRYGYCTCCGNRNLEHRCYCDGDHDRLINGEPKGCDA